MDARLEKIQSDFEIELFDLYLNNLEEMEAFATQDLFSHWDMEQYIESNDCDTFPEVIDFD